MALIADYQFDNFSNRPTTTTVNDATINANNATLQSGTMLQGGGGTVYIDTGYIVSFPTVKTIEAVMWLPYNSGITKYFGIMSLGGQLAFGHSLNTGGIVFNVLGQLATVYPTSFTQDGIVHLAITIDFTTQQAFCYVNGNLETTLTFTTYTSPNITFLDISATSTNGTADATYSIGTDVGVGRVTIWDTQLTTQNIVDLYNNPEAALYIDSTNNIISDFGLPVANLVYWSPKIEGIGTYTQNALTGTEMAIVNAPTDSTHWTNYDLQNASTQRAFFEKFHKPVYIQPSSKIIGMNPVDEPIIDIDYNYFAPEYMNQTTLPLHWNWSDNYIWTKVSDGVFRCERGTGVSLYCGVGNGGNTNLDWEITFTIELFTSQPVIVGFANDWNGAGLNNQITITANGTYTISRRRIDDVGVNLVFNFINAPAGEYIIVSNISKKLRPTQSVNLGAIYKPTSLYPLDAGLSSLSFDKSVTRMRYNRDDITINQRLRQPQQPATAVNYLCQITALTDNRGVSLAQVFTAANEGYLTLNEGQTGWYFTTSSQAYPDIYNYNTLNTVAGQHFDYILQYWEVV